MLLRRRIGQRPRPRIATRTLVAAAALLVVAGALWAPAAPGQTAADEGTIGIRLLDAPTDRADDPRARTYIVDHLPPGATISRRIEVVNDDDEARELAVYPAAATIADGQMRFAPEREGNELTEWVSVDRGTVDLEPGGRREVTVSIDVPVDAAPGERYGVVWAEAMSGPPTAGQVTTVNRVGVRIYLSVGGDNEPASDFAIGTLEGRRDENGAASIVATVENTGGRALDLAGELSLRDGPGGLSAGPFPTEGTTTLGIDQTGTIIVPLEEAVPAGRWRADLVVRSGRVEREASATITIPDEPDTSGGAVAPDDDGDGWLPVAIAVGAAVVFVVGGGLWLLLRRRRSAAEEPV
ncbi:MAG TPA: hypothetical protein VGO60_14305 [Iamia sp.]|jgi:hypothetical protein|nr:hypothetical protein [Iamia sp.]